MSLKTMKLELKRISAQIGAGEEPVLLIVLSRVSGDYKTMDYPDFAGHFGYEYFHRS